MGLETATKVMQARSGLFAASQSPALRIVLLAPGITYDVDTAFVGYVFGA
jgi:hypothetical protein